VYVIVEPEAKYKLQIPIPKAKMEKTEAPNPVEGDTAAVKIVEEPTVDELKVCYACFTSKFGGQMLLHWMWNSRSRNNFSVG